MRRDEIRTDAHPESAHLTGRFVEPALLAAIACSILLVFLADVVTPVDEVSVSFAYALPILITFFSRYNLAYWCAAAATALSLGGIPIQPPAEHLPASFFANRGIAIAAQWAVAALVTSRKRMEGLMRANLDKERAKADGQRRFLDVLSHEIGTSLTTIDGHAFRLVRKTSLPDAEELAMRGDRIRSSVKHIQQLVQRVQFASEADEQVLYPEIAPVAPKLVIAEAVDEARRLSPATPIGLDIETVPGMIEADPFMLRQIVDNLVSNAIKYSSPGQPISVEGRRDGRDVVLCVTDRGRGIADDEKASVLAPYYRARNSRGIHGAGVGLYVVSRFVEAHGGKIHIDTRLGHGTAVTVRLPIGGSVGERANEAELDPLH